MSLTLKKVFKILFFSFMNGGSPERPGARSLSLTRILKTLKIFFFLFCEWGTLTLKKVFKILFSILHGGQGVLEVSDLATQVSNSDVVSAFVGTF